MWDSLARRIAILLLTISPTNWLNTTTLTQLQNYNKCMIRLLVRLGIPIRNFLVSLSRSKVLLVLASLLWVNSSLFALLRWSHICILPGI